MGGNSRQKKSTSSSSFSFFKLFRSKRTQKSGEDYYTMQDEAPSARSRVWPSDEDRGRWVAEPGIDRKAEDFIAKIHRNIAYTETESQTFTIPSINSSTTTITAATKA